MERPLVNIDIEGRLSELSLARSALESALKLGHVQADIQSSVLICFSEIATNAIEHGSADKINTTLVLHADRLSLVISDDGLHQDYSKITSDSPLDPQAETPLGALLNFDTQQESGRGLQLVATLAESLSSCRLLTETSSFSCPSQRDNLVSFQKKQGCTSKQANIPHYINKNSLGWSLRPIDNRPCALLVDDDRALTALYESYLENDYKVLVANNGAYAIELLNEHPVDIVVSDINMPEMNGIKLREIIGKNENTASIPFVFLTMDDNIHTNEHAIHLGIDDFILKPVNKHTLHTTIQRVLTHYRRLSNTLNTRVNQQISSALSPVLPKEVFGWKIRIASRNTGTGGGDLVVFHQGKNAAYIALMDVMGHNDTAKFFSYAYAGFVRGAMLALREEQVPTTLLENLSHQIHCDALLGQTYLTCCIIKISSQGLIELASAGHPPSYFIPHKQKKQTDMGFTHSTDAQDNGALIPIHGSGMMLGLLASQTYTSTPLAPQPGDRLAVYTDGLMEGASDERGRNTLETEILKELSDSQDRSIDESVKNSMQILDRHTNNCPPDDALLILMERCTLESSEDE